MFCGVLAYADDIVLVSSIAWVLQLMLDVCYEYGIKWHYTFNAAKSGIMVFRESLAIRCSVRPAQRWYLGPSQVDEVDTMKHLGLTLSVNGSFLNHTISVIASARSAFYALQGIGRTQIWCSTPCHLTKTL